MRSQFKHGNQIINRYDAGGQKLKIANLAQDGQILQIARNTAIDILEKDPNLVTSENKIFATQLKKMKTNAINWGAIS